MYRFILCTAFLGFFSSVSVTIAAQDCDDLLSYFYGDMDYTNSYDIIQNKEAFGTLSISYHEGMQLKLWDVIGQEELEESIHLIKEGCNVFEEVIGQTRQLHFSFDGDLVLLVPTIKSPWKKSRRATCTFETNNLSVFGDDVPTIDLNCKVDKLNSVEYGYGKGYGLIYMDVAEYSLDNNVIPSQGLSVFLSAVRRK